MSEPARREPQSFVTGALGMETSEPFGTGDSGVVPSGAGASGVLAALLKTVTESAVMGAGQTSGTVSFDMRVQLTSTMSADVRIFGDLAPGNQSSVSPRYSLAARSWISFGSGCRPGG